MKIVSLNVEGNNHFKRVHAFLRDEQPDVLCLQEAPDYFCQTLKALGYTSHYAPMKLETLNGETYPAGVLIGSKLPMVVREQYYVGTRDFITVHKVNVDSSPIEVHPYLMATIKDTDGTEYNIATTHLMVTENGLTDENQKQGFAALMTFLDDELPHVVCGDFNMPRGYNVLYEEMVKRYTDAIPKEYGSSLDRDLHKAREEKQLNAPIFDVYMVDYIFTQLPYVAQNVRLQFGVSDHAAVIGDITQKPS